MPKGKSYNFTFINEVKSFITRPRPVQICKTRRLRDFRHSLFPGAAKDRKVTAQRDGGKSWGEGRAAGR